MKKKHIIYTLSTITLTIALGNVNDSNAFFGLDSFISRNKAVSDVVNIRDNNLLKAINNQLGRGEVLDSVTIADMERLTTLNAQERDIFSIEGLEYAINLRTLYLYNNKISDISSLGNLTNLNTLSLYSNQISDISALRNLTNLTYLHLSKNQISDISVLKNLTNLTEMHISRNNIEDVSSLRNLVNFKILSIYNNQISDISAFENLTKLTSLELQGNQISDISALGNLTNLKELYLQNNQISDISLLSNLTNLKELHLSNNQISDISVLSNLTNLKELHLGKIRISDMSVLENLTNLTNLTYLSLRDNQISDISVLSNLTNLNTLYLYNNQISDISVLENLTNLTDLRLDNNKIHDITPIKNLKKLTALNLSNQKPIIDAGDFKTETNTLDICINNPIIGLFDKVSNVTNISNSGVYEKGNLKWNSVPLGSHTRTFNFSENVAVGSATATFNGTATLNFNVVDGGAPESDHTSEFDSDDFGIYTTVTANDLGVGVDYLMHKGVRQQLPYRFKYDILEPSNNVVEVYDLVGNKADYEVKLKDSDIPTIEEGLDALIVKDNIKKEDISYFRTIINDLDESSNKDLLQDKLNNIFPNTFELERKSATGNLDVYVKSQNMLSMSLDTNSVTFDGYSGTEDMEMLGVVNISINSSLPYSLNAYMPNEIANADKSEVLPTDILNIRDESEGVYQTFANTTDKVVLKDNCAKGNDLVHSIDLKLSSNLAHKADVYKTVIKFEAEQK